MKPGMKKGGGGEDREPFVPTPEWMQAFESQWVRETMDFAARYAWKQARKVAHARTIDESYAPELIQDIIDDTLLGVIAWDPDRVSLQKHVLDAIKSRTRHDVAHARKFRPVRLDDCTPEAEAKLAEAQQHPTDVSAIALAVLAALRVLAQGDREVTLLLDAYDLHVSKKFEVMKLTGLTNKQYRAARGRMERLTEALPANLRSSAIDPE
jgi:hypothetical protein